MSTGLIAKPASSAAGAIHADARAPAAAAPARAARNTVPSSSGGGPTRASAGSRRAARPRRCRRRPARAAARRRRRCRAARRRRPSTPRRCRTARRRTASTRSACAARRRSARVRPPPLGDRQHRRLGGAQREEGQRPGGAEAERREQPDRRVDAARTAPRRAGPSTKTTSSTTASQAYARGTSAGPVAQQPSSTGRARTSRAGSDAGAHDQRADQQRPGTGADVPARATSPTMPDGRHQQRPRQHAPLPEPVDQARQARPEQRRCRRRTRRSPGRRGRRSCAGPRRAAPCRCRAWRSAAARRAPRRLNAERSGGAQQRSVAAGRGHPPRSNQATAARRVRVVTVRAPGSRPRRPGRPLACTSTPGARRARLPRAPPVKRNIPCADLATGRLRLAAALAVVTLGLAACGSDDAESGTDTAEAPRRPSDLKVGLAYDIGGRGDQLVQRLGRRRPRQGQGRARRRGDQESRGRTPGHRRGEERLRVLAEERLQPDHRRRLRLREEPLGEGRPRVPRDHLRHRRRRRRRGRERHEPASSPRSRARSWSAPPRRSRRTSGQRRLHRRRADAAASRSSRSASPRAPRQVKPDIEVQTTYLSQPPDFSGFDDPAQGPHGGAGHVRRRRRRHLRRRRRLRLGGLFEAAGRPARWPSASTPTSTSRSARATPSCRTVILTSMVKRVDVAVFDVLSSVRRGRGARGRSAGLRPRAGRRRLRHLRRSGRRHHDQLDELKQQIIDGEIEVPTRPPSAPTGPRRRTAGRRARGRARPDVLAPPRPAWRPP